MTVTLEITWSLTRVKDDEVVWRKAIVSSLTAKAGEAFAGVTRLRLANEGAARKNMAAGIAAIADLYLN